MRPKNVWFLPWSERDLAFAESPEGLDYLEQHFGTVVIWSSCYLRGASRTEVPHGEGFYTITPGQQMRFMMLVNNLRQRGIHPVLYIHPYFAQREGYMDDDVIAWCRRMRDDWGVQGVYVDGPHWGNAISTYEFWRRLREVWPDGTLVAHDSRTARGRDWHGRWIGFVNLVFIGENDGTDWLNDREIIYHLLPTSSGPGDGFFLKFHDFYDNGDGHSYQLEVYRKLRRMGVVLSAKWGWQRLRFDKTLAEAAK